MGGDTVTDRALLTLTQTSALGFFFLFWSLAAFLFAGFCGQTFLDLAFVSPAMPLLLSEGLDGSRGRIRRKTLRFSGSGFEFDMSMERISSVGKGTLGTVHDGSEIPAAAVAGVDWGLALR